MKFEIWNFHDSWGETWHLQPSQDGDPRYNAFLRHVAQEVAEGWEVVIEHEFEAESLEVAQRIYRRWLRQEGRELDYELP